MIRSIHPHPVLLSIFASKKGMKELAENHPDSDSEWEGRVMMMWKPFAKTTLSICIVC